MFVFVAGRARALCQCPFCPRLMERPDVRAIRGSRQLLRGEIRMRRVIITVVTVTFVALAVAPSAFAQATRTWVSGVGDDANPCSRTAPCKTWAGAISKTATGGEINALDPGGYGGLTITKAITVEGNGTLASGLVSGANGFVINIAAGPTNRNVVLR